MRGLPDLALITWPSLNQFPWLLNATLSFDWHSVKMDLWRTDHLDHSVKCFVHGGWHRKTKKWGFTFTQKDSHVGKCQGVKHLLGFSPSLHTKHAECELNSTGERPAAWLPVTPAPSIWVAVCRGHGRQRCLYKWEHHSFKIKTHSVTFYGSAAVKSTPMWGPSLERHVANVQAALLYFLGICIWKWSCHWNLPCEKTQPLRRLRMVGKVKLPPNCQHRLKYILTPFPHFPSGVLQWFAAGWAHNLQRIMGWAEMNDASSHGPGQVLRGSIGFSPWKLSTRHRFVVKSEWHHPCWSAQHSRYNTVILNINSSILGIAKYSDEKGCPSFEGPALERDGKSDWSWMGGMGRMFIQEEGRAQGGLLPGGKETWANKAEMGREKVQADSDCEVMPNSLWPHGL